ncbi:MAG: HlyD family secretion protein [Tannerellaceae bacterium]|jgi:HlyD family secretion protein|nr:HlyD family secretion protein [Tannerellaceae bacterium]
MEHKEVEIRSEAVQEVMGKVPSWIVRWGITLLFAIVLVLLTGSYFFTYPDVIVTEMTLTSRYPVAQVVARASGKMNQLYITDGQAVTTNMLLAVIENPAKTEDVMRLPPNLLKGGLIGTILSTPPLGGWGVDWIGLELGDIQPAYTSYLRSLHEYNTYYTLNYYPKKLAATRGQITKYQAYYQNLKRQQEVMDAQFTLARQQYERDSLLYMRGVISPSEHETARSTMLQSRHSLEGTNASLENLKIQIGELETGLLDLELQQAEKESLLQQDLQSNMEQLTNAINTWELTYCLTSPIEGNVTFTNYWNENQYVNAGESVFSIVPDKKEEIIGKALLPIARSGKVKTGQRVIIRFNNFPDQEFGIVNGVVNAISLVPADNNYQVEIGLPDGLVTNYNKTLPVTHEMKASAEIVTEDLRLIERFFMPLKQVLKEGF